MLLATVGYVLLPSSVVWANPSGEQVVGGAATFQRDGNTLTVNQSTHRVAINWQDFSIAKGETTHFNMPNSASIALNRVLGGNPSQIYGTLSSNGNIILVNNAGIFVGPGGIVNTASFVGSTLDIDPQEFMRAGLGLGMHLQGDSYAPIVNQGNITAEKGDVFLVAQKVENRGTISATKGKAALVGVGRAEDRTEVVLHEVGGSGFAVRVTQLEGEAAQGLSGELPDGEELLNEGEIAAAQAELNASGNIYALAIKNTGTIRAKAVVAQADGTVRLDGGLGDVRNTGTLIAKNAGEEATAAGGKIEVTGKNVTASPDSVITAAGGVQGGDGGRVTIDSADTTIVQGKVDVSAPSAGAKAGKVELLGQQVGLFEGAKVDASGGAGGGTVLVGGDYLGGGTPKPELVDLAKQEAEPVKNARATFVAETAQIKADATVDGDGGKIILWSDEYTGFYGQLFARGAGQEGVGGFIETSSLRHLDSWGSVQTAGANGRGGTWLLDPIDVAITTANNSSGGTPANMSGGGTWVPDAANSTVSASQIQTALNANNNVTITTAGTAAFVDDPGNITVNANIVALTGTGRLTLVADNSIIVNNNIQILGNVGLVAQGGDITVNGSGSITSISNLAATPVGGVVSIVTNGGGNITLGGRINAYQGISIVSGGGVEINNAVGINNSTNLLTPPVAGGAGNIFISAAQGILVDGSISTLLARGAGGNILLDANGGNIGGTGTIVLADPSLATLSSLAMQATGNIGVFVNAPVVAELDPMPAAVWIPQDAGPPIAADAGGNLTINNVGLVGSAIVVGTVNNIIGMNSGGDMELNAGAGNLILGGSTTISGGDFVARSREPTAGIIFATPSDRLTPAVTSSGRQTYFNLVTLNTAPGLPAGTPTGSAAWTYLRGDGIQFRGSINDGSIDGVHIPVTGRESLHLFNSGVTELVDYVGTARTSTDGLGAIVHVGPLYQFRQEGGSINFYATGTAAELDPLDLTLGPSIYVLDNPAEPGLPGGGSVTFDDANLVLYSNTYITGASDITFGGTVDSDFLDKASPFVVTTLVGDGITTFGNGGSVIFNNAVGGTTPLGALLVTANGQDAQININGGAVTFAGKNPVKAGADGSIVLTSSGAVVLAGTIETNGEAGTVGGGISITSGGGANQNIQVGGTGTTRINTRGGGIEFLSDVIFIGATTMDTTSGNFSGNLTFAEAASSTANLSVLASGSVTFEGLVNMGGDFTFNNLSGSFNVASGATIRSNVDANGNPFDLTINSIGAPVSTSAGSFNIGTTYAIESLGTTDQAQWNSIAGTVGQTYEVGSVFTAALNGAGLGNGKATDTFVSLFDIGSTTAAVGAVTIRSAGVQTYLNGNITTAGGQVELAGPVTLMKDSAINTTALNSGAGANIIFRQALSGNREVDSGGGVLTGRGLTLNAGAGGSIQFGNGTSSTVGQRLGSLTVAGSTAEIIGAGGGFSMLGTVTALNLIDINAPVNPLINGGAILFTSVQNNINLRQSILGQSNTTQGSDVTLTAENGTVTVGGNITLNGASLVGNAPGFRGGNLNVSAKTIVLKDLVTLGGSDNEPLSPGAAEGGTVTLKASGGLTPDVGTITVGSITTQGGEQGVRGPGGAGGKISLEATGTINTGYLNSSGGNTEEGVGGAAGDISITSGADFRVPSGLLAVGGDGTDGSAAFAGRGGTVSITTNRAGADVAFSSDQLVLQGDMSLKVRSAGNITLGVVNDFTKPLDPQAGTVLTLNADVNSFTGELQSSSLLNRGSVVFEFGAIDTTAEFLMPSSGSLITQGGVLVINRASGAGATTGSQGRVTLSGAISTSATGRAGGQVVVNTTQTGLSTLGAGGAREVVVNSTVDTRGGTAGTPDYGRNGGAVTIAGTKVILNRIVTSGSPSLEDAGVPAFGGAGGNITITASDAMTLRRNLEATGGSGLGLVDANGGNGGNITLNGNVILNSGRTDITSIILDTQGGELTGAGNEGVGGNITVTGTITGSLATSNTLDLRYGSGTVTLGDAAADTITLGTLITAADDARSTGVLRINGALAIDTLTTYARGYSIEILGGGKVATSTDFLNTGYVQIGNALADTTEFTGGINTQNGPSATVLAGTIKTSREVSNAGLLLGNVELFAKTILNTFGNPLQVGTVNSITTSQDLVLDKEMGDAVIQFLGAVGAGAGTPSVLDGLNLVVPGKLTLETPRDANGDAIVRTTPIVFGSTVKLVAIDQQSGTPLEFNNDVTLTGTGAVGSTFADDITLFNEAFTDDPTAVLVFSAGAATSFQGAVILENGPIELTGAGAITLQPAGTLDGEQNLFLSGAGTKTFLGVVGGDAPIGSGLGHAITMSGGQVTFGNALTTQNGITSATRTVNGAPEAAALVEFRGLTTIGSSFVGEATVLNGGMILNGATIDAESNPFKALPGDPDFSVVGTTRLIANSSLLGTGKYVLGTLDGPAGGVPPFFRLAFAGTGEKVLSGTVVNVLGFDQGPGSGLVTFQQNVTTTGANNFNASVLLDGLTFTAGGLTTFGTSSKDVLTLSSGPVTLQGTGGYTVTAKVVGGSQDLTLADATVKNFQSAVSGVNTLTLNNAGTSTFNSTLGAVTLTQNAGILTLNGNVSLTGAGTSTLRNSFLNSLNLSNFLFQNSAGITDIQGTVTTGGITTMTSTRLDLNASSPLVANGTRLTLTGPVRLGADVTLAGTGALVVNGAITRDVLGRSLTFAGLGTKTLSSSVGTVGARLTTVTQNAGSGEVLFGGDVFTSGDVTMNAQTTVDGSVTVDSDTAEQLYSTLRLAGDFTAKTTSADVNAVTFGAGGVSGTGNVAVRDAAGLAINGLIQNTGTFTASKADSIALGAGGYVTAPELLLIGSSGGATFQSTGPGGNVSATGVQANDKTSLSLVSDQGSVSANTVTAKSGLNLDAATTVGITSVNTDRTLSISGGGAATFAGSSKAKSMSLDALTVNDPLTSTLIDVSTLGNIVLRGPAPTFSYNKTGNLTVSGRIDVNTGSVILNSSQNFVNRYQGNPFTASSVKILTRDFFSYPSSAAVPGLNPVFGVTSIGQVGDNQIGVELNLLAGSGGPYIEQFTTGTGQPYVLATQNPVPPVGMATPVVGAGAFGTRVTYTEDELEMMTPAERAALEASRRQQSARVILERNSGESEEIGFPSEGEIPQASAPEGETPAPTAQVTLQGKPLASKSDPTQGKATKLPRPGPSREVALRSDTDVQMWLENERMTAEVGVGGIPVAGNR